MWIIFIVSMAIIALISAIVIGLTYRIIVALIKTDEKCTAEFERRRKENMRHYDEIKENIKQVKEN